MTTYLACKQAIQKARQLGPSSTNRVADLRAQGVAAKAIAGGGFLYATRGDAVKARALDAALTSFRAAALPQAPLGASLAANADMVCRMAALVERFGLGNCGELSTVAFHYLRRQPLSGQVGYIDWRGGNHVFVVAGLPAGLATTNWPYDPDEAPPEWGNEAVWCDPWTGNCFDTWKKAPWSLHSKSILTKTDPGITTDLGRRATSFRLFALSPCNMRR
jgi:hypothetical protein